MGLKPIVTLAVSLAAVTKVVVDAHGGLVIPPCRNNHDNTDLFNFTRATGELWMSGGSCAGDMCLSGLLTQGVLGVPGDPFAPLR